MFEFLGDAAGALLGGGVTGIIGTVVSFGTNWLQRRQKHAQELELRKLDMEHAQIEAASIERTAEIEAETDRDIAAASALEASYAHAATRISAPGDHWTMRMVDVVRGLTRPALTLLFLALTAAIYFDLGDGEKTLRGQITDSVLFMTVTCTLWWFGARQVAKSAGGK